MYKNKRNIFPFSILVVMALIAVFSVGIVAAQSDTEGGQAFLGIALSNTEAGVQVTEVLPASPAETAGLLAEDIITAVDGTPVSQAEEVQVAVAAYNVGDTVTLEITREGEEAPLTVEVILGNRADIEPETTASITRGHGRGGVSLLLNLNDGTIEISELNEDTPLYEAGLRVGDVITAVNGEPLNTQDFSGFRNRDEAITLTIIRDGETQDIEVAPELFNQRGFGFTGQELRENYSNRGNNNGRGGNRGGRDNHNWQPVNPMMMGRGAQLGVSFTLVDEALVAEHSLTVDAGAYIDEVIADTPAAQAGLEVGDVVIAVNGEPVNAATTLRERINLYDAGDEVALTVVRGDETLEITIALAENVPTFFRSIPFRQTTPPSQQEEVTPTEEATTEPSV